MAIVMTDAEDIVRGEDRQFQFYFVNAGTTTQASLPTGAAGHAYSLTLTHTDGGTAIVTKTFGAADYDAGTERWNFTVAAASTALLSAGYVCYGTVRRTDSGNNKVLYKFTCTVG